MTIEAAKALWGAEAVRKALDEPNPDPITAELADEVEQNADPPAAFRAWALAQPWQRFCAIVRIVSGAEREEVTKRGGA